MSKEERKALDGDHGTAACGKDPFDEAHAPGPPGSDGSFDSRDEYPFAATEPGGPQAIVRGVPLAENLSQGGQGNGFLVRNANRLNTENTTGLFYVCARYGGRNNAASQRMNPLRLGIRRRALS